MKLIVTALIVMCLGSYAASASPADASVANVMNQQALVVDVRTPEEFAQGHFPGAINIPHDNIFQGMSDLRVGSDQIVLLYCRSGNRSGQAEAVLQSAGFSGAKNVGGLETLLAATGTAAVIPPR